MRSVFIAVFILILNSLMSLTPLLELSSASSFVNSQYSIDSSFTYRNSNFQTDDNTVDFGDILRGATIFKNVVGDSIVVPGAWITQLLGASEFFVAIRNIFRVVCYFFYASALVQIITKVVSL